MPFAVFRKTSSRNTQSSGARRIGAKFGNGPGLPVTYLLDREGRIRQKFIGQTSRENFEAAIKPLLDEHRDGAKN